MSVLGILVDGKAEFESLQLVTNKLSGVGRILKPLHCDMQPYAPLPQIAYSVQRRIPILLGKGAEAILVLLDKENRQDCTVSLAKQLEQEIRKRLANTPGVPVHVVLKVRKFENWLIADPGPYKLLAGLFQHPQRIENAVIPDRADNLDALSLINTCTKSGKFNKVSIAKQICSRQDPEEAAKNSRSYRRFLRVLGYPRYITQSRSPV
jgi:hypothetical protein